MNLWASVRVVGHQGDPPVGGRTMGWGWPWPGLLLALGLWLASLSPLAAQPAELVMFREPGCPWCERWDAEVGVIYHKTDEGRAAPLRRVLMDQPRPADLSHIEGVRYSPTFVLMDRGREVGRILGYPGESHFWGLLGALLKAVPDPASRQAMGDM